MAKRSLARWIAPHINCGLGEDEQAEPGGPHDYGGFNDEDYPMAKNSTDLSKRKLTDLTWTGWLLILATGIVIWRVMIPWGDWVYHHFPPGPYPGLLLAAPALIPGLLFFAIGERILHALGFPIVKNKKKSDQSDI
jgi:hypothetical protein